MAPENQSTESPPLSDAVVAELREVLRRCSPETLQAACEFRRTGSPAHLEMVVRGVVERYVERELRFKLHGQDVGSLHLVEDLALDSLTMMEIVVLAEDVLKISVSNEELTGLRTIGDLNRFVASKVKPAPL